MTISPKFRLALKAALSVGLLGVLIWNIDSEEAISALRQFHPGYLLLCPLLVFIDRSLNWFRIFFLLTSQKVKVRFFDIARLYWISDFAALFMPGGVAVDALRGFMLSKGTTSPRLAAAAILMERILGFLSLMSLALTGAILGAGKIQGLHVPFWAILGFFPLALFLLFLVFWLGPKALRLPLFAREGLWTKIRSWIEAFLAYRHAKAILAKTFGISLAIQWLRIAVVFLLAAGLGLHVEAFYLFFLVPISFVTSMLPISLGGLGVQEGTYVVMLATAGIPATKSFLLAIIGTIITYGVSLPGLYLYLRFGLTGPAPIIPNSAPSQVSAPQEKNLGKKYP